MNKEAINFNERMLRPLTTKQQEEMLKVKGLKKCPECGYICFQLFAVCPKCDYLFKQKSGGFEIDKMEIRTIQLIGISLSIIDFIVLSYAIFSKNAGLACLMLFFFFLIILFGIFAPFIEINKKSKKVQEKNEAKI